MAWNFFKEVFGSGSTADVKNNTETKSADLSKEVASSPENIEAEIEVQQKEIKKQSAILSQEVGILLREELTPEERVSIAKYAKDFFKHASLAFLVLFSLYEIQTAHAKAKAERDEFFEKYPEVAEAIRHLKEIGARLELEDSIESFDEKIARWKAEAAALDSE